MGQFVLWTGVLCALPLVLTMIQRAVEWSSDAARVRRGERESDPWEHSSGDDSRLWLHV